MKLLFALFVVINGKMTECFWWSKTTRKGREEPLAHIIAGTETEETPSGTDGDVYIAFCGKEIQGWEYWTTESPKHKFGSFSEARKEGMEICEECFKKYNERQNNKNV